MGSTGGTTALRTLVWGLAVVGCTEVAVEHAAAGEPGDQDAGVDAALADAGTDTGPGEVPTGVPTRFLGDPDEGWRARLAGAGWERMERGSGGRSLGFRITLVDGSRGYFKPAQSFAGARHFAELAAYYVDRALGLGRVPPTVGRRFPMRALERAATVDGVPDPRLAGLEVDDDGEVPGAFVGWIEERLVRWRLGRGFEAQLRQDARPLAQSPFQPPRDWRDVLSGRVLPEETTHGQEPDAETLPDGARAELSDLILFDTLIHNVDRWGGDYTNVRRRGRGGPLIYLDNGAAFWEGEALLGLVGSRLRAVQRFRRSTVMAIEALDLDALRARMSEDPLGNPLQDERHWAGLETRRRILLRHVQHMHAVHGASIWLD